MSYSSEVGVGMDAADRAGPRQAATGTAAAAAAAAAATRLYMALLLDPLQGTAAR